MFPEDHTQKAKNPCPECGEELQARTIRGWTNISCTNDDCDHLVQWAP